MFEEYLHDFSCLEYNYIHILVCVHDAISKLFNGIAIAICVKDVFDSTRKKTKN